ncbi:MAG: hydroxyacid dehydrogenase [Thermomicrobiales bacterium]
MTSSRPRILVLPTPDLYHELFTPAADAVLRDLADVTFNDRDGNWSAADLAAVIPEFVAVVTGWRSPAITGEVLDAAGRLRLIAHSAGSVKHLLPPAVFERGIAVTSAAAALAPAVAEFALILVFLGLRPVEKYDRGMREGRWDGPEAFGPGQEIAEQRIGVVGASFVGRHFVGLVRALGAEVWVYDPYLSIEDAAAIGVRRADLPELMAHCPIVSVHAPTTPETQHMIGAAELRLLPDNALLVNTARSWVIDMDALLAELQNGRIRAALDVFDEEPLPVDSPFRHLDNVVVTPHIAGATVQARFRQGDVVVDEIRRFFAGKPLRYGITLERLAILA